MPLSEHGYQIYWQLLRRWRERSGLSDAAISSWIKELGTQPLASNVQWLKRATRRPQVIPTVVEFVVLAELNRAIAAGELGALSDQLQSDLGQLRPIADADGKVWGWESLIACYLGELRPPQWLMD